MTTAFDQLIDGFAALLASGTPVCDHIETDSDADPLPKGRETSISITLGTAQPQLMGGLAGNPVDWITDITVRCFASAKTTSARPAANALAAAAYARLAATPGLGIDSAKGVFIGEPRIDWDLERAETRLASAALVYSVTHRTSNSTLD